MTFTELMSFLKDCCGYTRGKNLLFLAYSHVMPQDSTQILRSILLIFSSQPDGLKYSFNLLPHMKLQLLPRLVILLALKTCTLTISEIGI